VQQGAKSSVNPLSIAVLPFTNLTGDPAQSYVADGLTNRVTSDLARIQGAVVTDAGRAMSYKDKTAIVQQVSKELGVRFILQGDVQRSADKILINAKLTDASSNKQLWSESFEGDMSDLFSLQDKVTKRIRASLGPQMVIVAASESENRKTNPQAADLMLRARASSLKGNDAAALEQRIELFKQALKLEPNNLDAMSALATSLALLAPRSLEQELRKSRFNESRTLALKVIEIDPKNSQAYYALTFYDRENDNLLGARQNQEKFLELSPNTRNVLLYTNVLTQYGETTKALEILTRNYKIHSSFPSDSTLFTLGRTHLVLGQTDIAIDYLSKAIKINSKTPATWASLAVAHTIKGETDQAAAAVAEVKKLNPKATSASLNYSFKPLSASVPAYKAWYEKTYMPAYRKAGLTE
jgi:TolB-like protein/Flp pilus assembly protein TadD